MKHKFLLSCVLLTGAHVLRSAAQNRAKPNILLIMADDMGFSDIACYGGEIHTPHIDSLAAEGIRFTRFYNNAWCSPTRASLLTGLYPQQAGMGVLAGPRPGPPGPYEGYLNDHCVTLAEVLKGAGYYTALSGKWHVGELRPHWPVDRRFDHYFGLISGAANYFDITKTKAPGVKRIMALDGKQYTPPKRGFYMTDAITDYAVKILKQQKDSKSPFFLYVAYTAPHWPLQAPAEETARYAGKYAAGWDSLRERRYRRLVRLGIISPATALSSRPSAVSAWDSLSPAVQEEMAARMSVYAAQVTRMDEGIGRILRQLKASGKEGNTLVIFLSDNGASAEGGLRGFDKRHNGLPPGGVDSYMSYGRSWAGLSNTPFRYYKTWLHEGGIATPFIVRWPAVIQKERQGSVVNQTGHVIDIMPTLCAVAGAVYPRHYMGNSIIPEQGQSLLGPIETGKTEPHGPVYWSLKGHSAVLAGGFKLVSAGSDQPWELYDLSVDRTELHDLAAKDTALVREYIAAWRTWGRKAHVFQDGGQQP